MWRVVDDSFGTVILRSDDLYIGRVRRDHAARIVAAMNAAEAKDEEIAALTYERDVFHSVITENDGPMATKTEALLSAAPEEYQRRLVRELCLSMASFIAEIDANSIDVASYLEQRLSPILMMPVVRRLLDIVGKDARQLVGWKKTHPNAAEEKCVCVPGGHVDCPMHGSVAQPIAAQGAALLAAIDAKLDASQPSAAKAVYAPCSVCGERHGQFVACAAKAVCGTECANCDGVGCSSCGGAR